MKLRILIAVIFLSVFLVSCNAGTDIESDAIPTQPEVLTNVYLGEEIDLPEGYEFVPQITPYYDAVSETIVWIGSRTERYPTPDGFTSETDYYVITTDTKENSVSYNKITPYSDGIFHLQGGTLYGDYLISAVRIDDSDSAEHRIMKYSMDSGEYDYSPPIDAYFYDYLYVYSLAVSGETLCLHTDTELAVLDKDHNLIFHASFPHKPESLCVSPDGAYYILADTGHGQRLYSIDIESKSMSEGITLSENHIRQALFGEDGTLYYSVSDGLYAYSDGSSRKLMDYGNSHADMFHLNIISVPDSHRMIAAETSYGSSRTNFTLFEKRDDIRLSEISTIEIAAAAKTYELTEAVNRFNRIHPDIHVRITDYYKYNTSADSNAGKKKLLFDISVEGYKPDIVYAHWDSGVIRHLLSNDLYLDLYPLIDSDQELTQDDFLSSYLRAYTSDGRLWGMTPYISVNTIAGLESACLPEVWTTENMLDYALSLDEGVSFTDSMTVSSLEEIILGKRGYGTFIENGIFNEAAFEKWLILVKDLPESSSYDTLSASEYEEQRYHEFLARKNGKTAVTAYSIADVTDWFSIRALFDSEETVLPGYPSSCGNRAEISTGPSFVITSFTDMPSEAWELMKSFCLHDYSMNLPILKSVLEAEADEYIGKIAISYYSGGNTCREYNPYIPFTEKDMKKPGTFFIFTEQDTSDFIEYIDKEAGFPLEEQLPEEIESVFREEVSAFRNGLYTSDECTKKVSSRVNLWLAEHE